MQTSNRVFALHAHWHGRPKPWPTAEAMELNSAISRHLIYRAIYILTQLAAPGVRRGINPPGSTRRLSVGSPKVSSPNISRTPTADPGEFCGQTAGAEFPMPELEADDACLFS